MSKLPSPQERPDLYDDFDYVERPAGQPTGVQVPERIQALINERQANVIEKCSLSPKSGEERAI